MSVQITIDTASRAEAEVLASALPGAPTATSVRGYGLIRARCRTERDVRELLDAVNEAVQRHQLPWARVRRGDEEHMFRGRLNHAT